MTTHALLSPSSSQRWIHCPASVALTACYAPEDDRGSAHALLGTVAHGAAYRILQGRLSASEACQNAVLAAECEATGTDRVEDTQAFCANAGTDWHAATIVGELQPYLAYVRGLHLGASGCLMLEETLDISHLSGEAGAKGTADCVAVLSDATLVVVDLKYGQGVPVYAQGNTQLQLYAAAALDSIGLLYDIKAVRLVIVQPRLNHLDEWQQSPAQIAAFAASIQAPAAQALHFVRGIKDGALPDIAQEAFGPAPENCRWCQVKGYCNALQDKCLSAVLDDLPTADEDLPEHVRRAMHGLAAPDIDVQRLSAAAKALALVRMWADAVQQRVEALLHQGQSVPGFKLVLGRAGNRRWESESAVADAFARMRLPVADFYTKTPVSPTECEKLHKAGKVGDRQWARLQKIITRSAPQPCVVPESDKRPAIQMADDLPDGAAQTPATNMEAAHA